MNNTKELYFDPLDIILPSILAECVNEEAESFLSQDTSSYIDDPRLWKRIRRSIKKQSRPSWRASLRISLIACLIIISMLFTACMCIPEVRSAMWESFIEWYEKSISIIYKPIEPVDSPTVIKQKARLTYIPAGYYSEPGVTEPDYADTLFYNSAGEYKFAFVQQTMLSEDGMVNYEEGDILSDVKINGYDGKLIEYPDEPKEYILIWTDGVYKYYLLGIFTSKEELFSVADGMIL